MPRGLTVLLGTAATVIAVAGMQGIAGILGPAFLALMLTVTIAPLSVWLRRRGAPAWAAVTASVAVAYLILLALGGAVAISVSRLVGLLPSYAKQFDNLQSAAAATLGHLGADKSQVEQSLRGIDPSTVIGLAERLVGGLTGAVTNILFILALLLFMGADAVHFPARMFSAASQRPEVVGALRSFAHGTRQYLVVSTVFGLIVAVIDTLVLWPLGIPLPVTWGILAFITNYIPNVGFIIGLVPPALLGLFEGGPELMLVVIVLYCAINLVIQSVIQPKFVGDAVGLSTTLTFVSLVFWAWVIGPLGALLAIPLSLLVKALLIDIDPNTQWIDRLVNGGEAAKPDQAPAAAPPEPETPQPNSSPADATT
jgi:AI-2 transport protein TqsA